MTSVANVKKQVKELKDRILPRPNEYLRMIFYFTTNYHRKHGKYGFQWVVYGFTEGRIVDYEALPEEEELRLMRKFYDEKIPDHAKRDFESYSWATFEDYKEYNRCKCGYHKERELCEA